MALTLEEQERQHYITNKPEHLLFAGMLDLRDMVPTTGDLVADTRDMFPQPQPRRLHDYRTTVMQEVPRGN